MKLLTYEPIPNGGVQMTWEVTIEREGSHKPACVAESVVRRYAARPGAGGAAVAGYWKPFWRQASNTVTATAFDRFRLRWPSRIGRRSRCAAGKALAQLRRQAARLRAEHEPVAGPEGDVVHRAACRAS